jgi:hypothetical protein
MMNAGESSSLAQPKQYKIRVQGALDPSWSARLQGLQIQVDRPTGRPPSTLLEGWLQDQAALTGVLTTLYGLGFSLMSVTTT